MEKKRFVSFITCVALLLTLLPVSVYGIATEAQIIISDKDDLKRITGSGNYKLDANIDLAGEDWTPLREFSGRLDGNGHKIINLSITDTTNGNKGLFTSIAAGGKVSNLGIEGANITAGDNVGIIAATNAGIISHCYTTGTVSGDEYVGGLVGVNTGTIENCFSRASVSGTDYLGGLAGSNSASITTSYAVSAINDSVLKNYLSFNNTSGGGGYIEIPHKDEYVGSAFTLEAWFQWNKVSTAAINFIIGKGFEQFEIHTGGDSGENGLRFIPIPSGEGYYDFGKGGYKGDSYIDVQKVLQTGWFHVAAVYWYDSENKEAHAQVYVNGDAQELYQKPNISDAAVKLSEKTASISRTSDPLEGAANNINIGRRTNASFYFDGKIADVRFWNTARTEAEIKANKDKVLNGNEAGLVGYWKLNESSGAAIDSSRTQNNGTVEGAVTRITASSEAANKGALVGSNTGTVEGCFYDSTVYGSTSGGIGTAATTDHMKTPTTFTSWGDTDKWILAEGSYPCFYKQPTPTATFMATGESTGTLSNVAEGMQYKVDDGSWKDITSSEKSITGLSACVMSLIARGDGISKGDSDLQTITISKAGLPDAVSAADFVVTQPKSVSGDTSTGAIALAEGKTPSHYEYRTKGNAGWPAEWITFEAVTLSGIDAPASIQVRIKTSGSALASAPYTISINKYVVPRSGGGSAPAGTVPVIVDGETYNIGTAQTEDGTTKVVLNQDALNRQLAGAGEAVIIPVTTGRNANTAAAELVVANVDEMAEKEMTLSVQVDNVSYDMPAVAVDTSALMKELGASNPEEVPVNVTITELSNDDVSLENGVLVLPPVQFTVTAGFGGRSVEVEVFQKYVQRVIEIPSDVDASRITTAVVVENGKQRHVPTEVFQKDGKWYARINSLTNSTYALINNEQSFADTKDKWFEAVVTEMASRGIINGKGKDTFAGDANITRAEFAAILVRALGLPENGDASAFKDVAKTEWYYGAVGKAYKYDLINGRGVDRFEPNANITRQEAMAMMRRAADIAEYAGSIGTLSGFRDAGSVSSWALADAQWNVGSGLISGSNGMINGQSNITRGETATIILRLLQKSELVDVRAGV